MLEIYVDLVNMFDYYYNIFEHSDEGFEMVGKSTQADLVSDIINCAKSANTKSIHIMAMNKNFVKPFEESLTNKGYNVTTDFIA